MDESTEVNEKQGQQHRSIVWRAALFVFFVAGILLRLGRLTWQPLWADEGYSIYYATEPLRRMVDLTAHDIHPPLYYALLHLWTFIGGGASPSSLRLFSLLTALPALGLIAALSVSLFPGRRRLMLLATVLLTLNPMHLFYSQEVRMYGLALSLTMASTWALWQLVAPHASSQRKPTTWPWFVLYVVTATAALYTLYYSAFLFVAHFIWLCWKSDIGQKLWRRNEKAGHIHIPGFAFGAYPLIALLYSPWLIYVATDLTAYIDDKVRSDQDVALGVGTYLLGHLTTFLAGHLTSPGWPIWWRWIGPLALLLLLSGVIVATPCLSLRLSLRQSPRQQCTGGTSPSSSALSLLWCVLLIPLAIAFAINLIFPFFPDGGERLLLFLLPYVLLLVASGVDRLWRQWHFGKVVYTLLFMAAVGGVWTFYTLPRHRADDYRPLVRQLVQQGMERDIVLATFPWQVGLWRAYAPLAGLPIDPFDGSDAPGPQMQLISERSVIWGEVVTEAIDSALHQGTLWYPGLRSIGSTLPAAVDRYLTERAVLLVDEWYGNTTLRAWHRVPAGQSLQPLDVTIADVHLAGAAVNPTTVMAANVPVRIDLDWSPLMTSHVTSTVTSTATSTVGMTLRLYRDDQLWAGRDLEQITATTGFIVPVGLPPGTYQLRLGLRDATGKLLAPNGAVSADDALWTLADLAVLAPSEPLLPARLPIQYPLSPAPLLDGVQLLGYSASEETKLAGEQLAVTLFWQQTMTQSPERHLYLSLLDEAGNGVAGWEGWPLPAYPMTAWPLGALVQTPVAISLPATLPTGTYRLGGGLLDPMSGAKSEFILLGKQAVRQRVANFTPVTPPQPLSTPVQFGSHVQLLGYELARTDDTLSLQLYWQVLQPLLPPHHLFVHLDDAMGETLAQDDGNPMTAAEAAPTGSWQPGEFLVTEQQLPLTAAIEDHAVQLTVGLYVPATGARLPTSIEGAVTGDHVTIPLD